MSSNGASASAQNVSNTSQTNSEIQTGSGDGQSQTVTQSAPTDQTATAAATSQQSPASDSNAASSDQSNQASSSSTATNAANTTQQSTQSQLNSATQPNAGQSQSAEQNAPTKQDANASATSTQVAPKNVNVVIRIDSPGNDGPVTQTNNSQASAGAGNTSSLSQGFTQAQNGAGSQGGQSQASSQSAPTIQSSQATASSTQTDPLNANIVIRNKSPGDEGAVTQTNMVGSTAGVANSNIVNQASNQIQAGSGPPAAGQSQSAVQIAPVVQAADATATSMQAAPTNTSLTIDSAAPDPNGSGAVGTLIQIWIPNQPDTSAPISSPAAGEAAQANSSNATASAGNVNNMTQSAVQQQEAGGRRSSGPTRVGGGSQSQVLEQSAPTSQAASAAATSIQAGVDAGWLQPDAQTSISSALAQAANVSEVRQSGTQIQHGGTGTQVQVLDQETPTNQRQSVETTSPQARGGSDSNVQVAGQARGGGAPHVSILQAANDGRGKNHAIFPGASPGIPVVVGLTQPGSGRAEPGSARSHEGRRHVRGAARRAPHEPKDPAPQESSMLGAPGNGAPGVSLWILGALLVPFFLTAPWWARRHRSAVFRRLLGVVLRLERPG